MPEAYGPARVERQKSDDEQWMRQALQQAESSTGMASPNPLVGCVLVRGGAVVGRGAHLYDRRDHAEVVALAEAGEQARNATAYVTLEPCAHTGRTPPCALALRDAGVARVVIATGDPNPLVNGKGIAMLREAGIAITLGVLIEEARALNDGFARWVRKGVPFVTLKAGLSLDGRIAPPAKAKAAGSVAYLTGARSLLAVQTMRHGADAVLTGIGTVIADNPLLTDRSGASRRRPLLRVVLDSQLRLDPDSRLVQSASGDLLVFTLDGLLSQGKRDRRSALEAAGVQVCAAGEDLDGRLELRSVLQILAEKHQVLNLLVEGGSALNRAVLDNASGAHLADKLCLFYAPMFLGEQGVPLVAGGVPLPLEMLRTRLAESGSDIRLDAYLRDPWRE